MERMKRFFVALVLVAAFAGAAFAAVHRDTMTFKVDTTTYGSITPAGIASMANYRVTNGATFTTADPNPTRAQLRAAGFFCVDTTANAVDLDLSNDADFEAADIGTTWDFVVCAGGTNALTVTNGASGVVIKPQAATTGTTAEDVGDIIRCTAYALEGAICITFAAD